MFYLFFIIKIISLFTLSISFDLTDEKIKHLDEMISSQVKSAKLNTFRSHHYK